VVELGAVSALMVHDLKTLRPGAVRGVQVVISGHSHQPKKETRDGVLYFNPGSAGPRRFTLPISIGRLDVERGPRAREPGGPRCRRGRAAGHNRAVIHHHSSPFPSSAFAFARWPSFRLAPPPPPSARPSIPCSMRWAAW
jgi:hypothetical protein